MAVMQRNPHGGEPVSCAPLNPCYWFASRPNRLISSLRNERLRNPTEPQQFALQMVRNEEVIGFDLPQLCLSATRAFAHGAGHDGSNLRAEGGRMRTHLVLESSAFQLSHTQL